MRRPLTVAALTVLLGGGATADITAQQPIHIQFRDGRVWLTAQEMPLASILREWARVGGTTLVNVDSIDKAPITIEFNGVTERKALDALLRGVPGYLLGTRQITSTLDSHFDRVYIVLPSRTTPATAAGLATAEPRRPAEAVRPDDDARTDDRELPEPLRVLLQMGLTNDVASPGPTRQQDSTGAAPGPDVLDSIVPRFLRE
jgi:hypothetical protein